MERVFPKSGDQPNKMALTICNLISRYFLLTRDWKPGILPNGKEISAVPFRKERALPLEVVYNFRTDFPENCCSISLSTEVSVFFFANGKHQKCPKFKLPKVFASDVCSNSH